MRLIDADKLTELCDIMSDKCCGVGESVWSQFRTTVEWSPTVDAVPVIRCKDCKYVSVEPCKDYENVYVCDRNYWTRAQGGNMPNDFCSHAERREE